MLAERRVTEGAFPSAACCERAPLRQPSHTETNSFPPECQEFMVIVIMMMMIMLTINMLLIAKICDNIKILGEKAIINIQSMDTLKKKMR